VGVAVVVAVLALTSGGGEDPTDGARGQATPASGAPAGSEGRVAATIPVPKHPQGIAVVGEDVFVASDAEGLVERIDTRTNKAAGLRAVAPDPTWLAAGDGVLWEASTESEAVGRLRTPALEHLGTPVVRTGRRPSAIAAGGPEVWITEAAAGAASRIDPRTGKVRETVEVGDEPLAVAFDERGSFWVSNHGSGTIQRIDPDDESLVGDEIEVGPNPRGLAIAEGHVWVAVSGEGTVVRVSLDSDTVVGDPIAVGDTPVAVAAGEGSIWVVNQVDGTVTRIDAKTAKVVGEPIDVGKEPISVAVGVGAVWVSNASDDTVTRIDP
jgi:YVTN family beta-propeller protein